MFDSTDEATAIFCEENSEKKIPTKKHQGQTRNIFYLNGFR